MTTEQGEEMKCLAVEICSHLSAFPFPRQYDVTGVIENKMVKFKKLLDQLSFKRCPFCGSIRIELLLEKQESHAVKCLECGAYGPGQKNSEFAANAWNKRFE